MIRCHLSRLMGERKLKLIDVARATGIHRNMITLLYRETATRIDLDAMDKLCHFFQIGVGDLFEFMPQPPPQQEKPGGRQNQPRKSSGGKRSNRPF